jgi:hypothetical protein
MDNQAGAVYKTRGEQWPWHITWSPQMTGRQSWKSTPTFNTSNLFPFSPSPLPPKHTKPQSPTTQTKRKQDEKKTITIAIFSTAHPPTNRWV